MSESQDNSLKERAKSASLFNSSLLHNRTKQTPFYYDPYTHTWQSKPSFCFNSFSNLEQIAIISPGVRPLASFVAAIAPSAPTLNASAYATPSLPVQVSNSSSLHSNSNAKKETNPLPVTPINAARKKEQESHADRSVGPTLSTCGECEEIIISREIVCSLPVSLC
jgi:hypothetical protein